MKPIQIEDHTHKSFKAFCREKNLKLGEAANAALEYFILTGINPNEAKNTQQTKSLAAISEMRNTFITFTRNQEKTILKPILNEVVKSKITNGLVFEMILTLINLTADDQTAKQLSDKFISKIKGQTDVFKD